MQVACFDVECCGGGSVDDFTDGIFDDSAGSSGFESWDDGADDVFVDDGVEGDPGRVGEVRNGGFLQCR